MLLNQPSMLAGVLDVFKPVSVHLLGQVSHHLDQPVVAAGADDDIMKRHVRLGDADRVLGAGHLDKSVTHR